MISFYQRLPSTKNFDKEAISLANKKFKAESPTTNGNRLLERTKRALEAAMMSKMNGDQVSKFRSCCFRLEHDQLCVRNTSRVSDTQIPMATNTWDTF